MKNYGTVFAMLGLMVLSRYAHAQSSSMDPCRTASFQATQTQLRFSRTERLLLRQTRYFEVSRDRVESRLARLQSAVDWAQAYLRGVERDTPVLVTTCSIGWFLGYQYSYNCVNRALGNGINRRFQARAAYTSAAQRMSSYAMYAQGLLRRNALRVEDAQKQYNAALADRTVAQERYSQCRASNPCTPSGSFRRCY